MNCRGSSSSSAAMMSSQDLLRSSLNSTNCTIYTSAPTPTLTSRATSRPLNDSFFRSPSNTSMKWKSLSPMPTMMIDSGRSLACRQGPTSLRLGYINDELRRLHLVHDGAITYHEQHHVLAALRLLRLARTSTPHAFPWDSRDREAENILEVGWV